MAGKGRRPDSPDAAAASAAAEAAPAATANPGAANPGAANPGANPDTDPSVDPAEVARFAALAERWWDPATAPSAPCTALNPVRIAYVRDALVKEAQAGASDKGAAGTAGLAPLAGLRLLDVGCGGGLMAEPLCRLGASVVAVDAAEPNVRAARQHAEEQGLAIDYRHTTAEALAAQGERFDAVLALEIVEHVADLDAFAAACAGLVHPRRLAFRGHPEPHPCGLRAGHRRGGANPRLGAGRHPRLGALRPPGGDGAPPAPPRNGRRRHARHGLQPPRRRLDDHPQPRGELHRPRQEASRLSGGMRPQSLDPPHRRVHHCLVAGPREAEESVMSATKHGGIAAGCAFACLAAALWLSGPADAGCISQNVGNTTVHNCGGKIGVSQTVGNTTVHNFGGKTGTSQTVGNTTVHSFDGTLGTSQTVGTTTVHTIDGKFGLSQRIGTIVIHSGPLFDDR